LQLEKASPTDRWTYFLISIEATGICIRIGTCEVLLVAVYKSQNRTWCNIDMTELLGFRNKCVLVGVLNAKHPLSKQTFFFCFWY
jgi:hypothetical protein